MTCKVNADTTNGLKLTSDTSGAIDLQTNGTTKVHMDSSGKVGIGTSSPDQNLHVSDTSTNAYIKIISNDSNTAGILFGDQNSGLQGKLYYLNGSDAMRFDTNGSERMRIDSDGDLLVATTTNISSSGGAFQVKSRSGSEHVACFQNGVSNGGWGIPFFNVAGSEVGSIRWTASVTNFNTSSDYRLKENVTYTFDATTEVKRLRPCKFNFIGESETVEGFLAHEVSDVVPLAVTGTKDATKVQDVYDDDGNVTGTETVPIYQSIDQSKLVPLLVKTIQELEARITALENN